MTAKIVTDASFDSEVTNAAGAVLVDFWAPWCGPCRTISPALEEIGTELGERLTVAKVNVDENPESVVRFGIRGIPTLILFRDGAASSTKVGAASKGDLREWIEASL